MQIVGAGSAGAARVREGLRRCGFDTPETDLDTLVSCCLLRVHGDDGTLAMHDQLRDLATKLVRDEGRAAQRSRLCGKEAATLLDANTVGARNRAHAPFQPCT